MSTLADKVVGIVEDLIAEACNGRVAQLEKENAELKARVEKMRAALEDVLLHRKEDKDGNHVTWVGETCFLMCEAALATHPTPESK